MRYLLLTILGLCHTAALAQSIHRVEYFVDTDPGYGEGIVVMPGDEENISFTVDVGNLTGIHTLFVRAEDENYVWSTTHNMIFLVETLNVGQPADIILAEYFFDTDPGYGNGTPISFSPGPESEISFTAGLSALTPGLHTMYVRTRDQEGRWSTTHHRTILVESMENYEMADLVRAEYFFDVDPGFGNGNPVPLTPGTDLEINFAADLSSLTTGSHQLYLRVMDEMGRWSTTLVRSVLVEDINTGNLVDIVAVEYFIDTDPGYGKGIAVPLEPDTVQNLSFTADISGLDSGYHTLYVRARDALNRWSSIQITGLRRLSTSPLCYPAPEWMH